MINRVPVALAALLLTLTLAGKAAQAKIIVLVNDEPITAFDLNQRLQMMAAQSKDSRRMMKASVESKKTQQLWKQMIQEAQPTTRAEVKQLQAKLFKRLRRGVQGSLKKRLRKKALDELIEEKLKIQQARKLNVAASSEDIDDQLTGIASQNKGPNGKTMTKAAFLKALKSMGIPPREYKKRLTATMSWNRLMQSKFRFQVSVNQTQVDDVLAKDESAKESTVYKLQRVRFLIPARASSQQKAKRLAEAESFRERAKGCSGLGGVAKKFANVNVNAVGNKTAKDLSPVLASYVSMAGDGQLTPPTLTASGIELYAVCGKSVRRADIKKRKRIEHKLRIKEMKILGERYLQDLKQDAFIEHR